MYICIYLFICANIVGSKCTAETKELAKSGACLTMEYPVTNERGIEDRILFMLDRSNGDKKRFLWQEKASGPNLQSPKPSLPEFYA